MPANRTLSLRTRRHVLGVEVALEGLKYFWPWILAAVVLAAILPAVIAQYRAVDVSAWFYAANAGKFFTAITGGLFLFALFPILIAQGMTRREFAAAMGVFGLVWSFVLGALAVAGFLGEHAVYGVFDWNHAIGRDGGDLQLESIGAVIDAALPYPPLYLLYFTAGAMIGAACCRWDAGWLIIVPVVPVTIALDDAISSTEPWGPGWFGVFTRYVDGWGTWPALIALAAVIAGGAWLIRRILLDTPVRAKKA